MSIELSRLQALRFGPERACTPIGEVPREVSDYLRTEFRTVNLSREGLAKLNEEHKDLSDFDLLQLPYLISHGLWISERHKPTCAIASCPWPGSTKRYKVAIKRAKGSPELWLMSLHRLNPRATKALLKRGPILRRFKP